VGVKPLAGDVKNMFTVVLSPAGNEMDVGAGFAVVVIVQLTRATHWFETTTQCPYPTP
jgi:hypothetical protein